MSWWDDLLKQITEFLNSSLKPKVEQTISETRVERKPEPKPIEQKPIVQIINPQPIAKKPISFTVSKPLDIEYEYKFDPTLWGKGGYYYGPKGQLLAPITLAMVKLMKMGMYPDIKEPMRSQIISFYEKTYPDYFRSEKL